MSEFPPLVLSSWSGLAVFVLPGLFVVRIMRRRRWSLAEWMLLPVIVGLLLLTFRLLVEHQFFQRFDRPALHVLHQAAIGSTLSVFPALLLVAAMRRRWLHVVGLLALSVFISGAAAAVILAVGQSELAAEERFSTEGWYVIWLWGAYLTGWLVLAVLLVRRLIILVRQRSARQPG